jgi:5-methylcytosine-specific restriction endonuclease McrA
LRKKILARDKYLDQYLKRYGKFKTADIVHHIFPVDEYPEYQYCEWNLISLSRSTHNMMHDRDTDELTDIGKELLVRTARRNGIEVPAFRERKKGLKYNVPRY